MSEKVRHGWRQPSPFSRNGSAMRIYDITVPLGAATPIWDNGKPPVITFDHSLARGEFGDVTSLSLGSHSGTHTDAPSHFVSGGWTVDQIPVDRLVGPAVVIEHEGTSHITAEDLSRMQGLEGVRRVLFKTQNGRLWESGRFEPDFIALTESAADYLVSRGVELVGMDYLGIEPYEAGDECPVHKQLMEAGVIILEGADLRQVPPGEYFLVCAPIKLVGCEGAPTRAFLLSDL